MKQILFSILVVLTCISAYSQNGPVVRYRSCNECSNSGLDNINSSQTFTYDTARTYPAIQVADDYGPRQNDNNLYDWHGGIDYNSGPGNTDMGDLALAILGGTIKGSLGQFYKYLVVEAGGGENFGYGHFFTNDGGNLPLRSGGCWLSVMTNNVDRCIVMTNDGDTSAIGTIGGNVNFDGKTFPVSNMIAAGAPIGPTGYSGQQSGAHLHLWVNPDGSIGTHDTVTKNPLQFVHYDTPEHEVNLRRVTHYANNTTVPWDSTGIVYPGNKTTHVVVRPTMLDQGVNANRYDVINDVDRVELMLINKGANSTDLIRGKDNFSWIWVGGLMGEEMYPHYMYRDGSSSNGGGTKHIGSLERQGIRPFAYATNGAHPYDDYYFPDFYTRIHKDHSGGALRTAELPANARYPDGEYALFAQVTNIRDQVTSSDTLSFTLDNFKPYVQRVEVSQSPFYNSGSPFYIVEWEEYWQPTDWAGTGKLFFTVHQADPIQAASGQYLKIVAQVSEPMEDLDKLLSRNQMKSLIFI